MHNSNYYHKAYMTIVPTNDFSYRTYTYCMFSSETNNGLEIIESENGGNQKQDPTRKQFILHNETTSTPFCVRFDFRVPNTQGASPYYNAARQCIRVICSS